MNERKPRERLKRLVAGHDEAGPRLPFAHSTDVLRFVNALEDGELTPQPCKVFKEPLLYFFYGRPSFRVNSSEGALSLEHYLPVCLLFKNSSVGPIRRILPFDSGAFAKGLYQDAVHYDMRLEDFFLDPDPSTPGKVVSLFFKDAPAYLSARAIPVIDVASTELEAASCHAIASNRLTNSVDNRGSGVEVQIGSSLPIIGNVEAVVLPSTFLDNSGLRSKLSASGVEVIAYNQIDRQRPSEYTSEIFALCRAYYERAGLIAAVGG